MRSALIERTSDESGTRVPYPMYKDSSVPWLGRIPAHWELLRLKYVAKVSADRLNEKPADLPYLGLEHVESGTGRLLLQNPVDEVDSVVGLFDKGDVLFGKLRPYLAKVVHASFRGVCTTELLIYRTNQHSDGRYLFYLMLSDWFIDVVNAMTYGAKMPRANAEQIGNLNTPVPSLPEQQAIASYLDRETARIDTLVAKKERLIALLEEKRSALISQAVTRGLDPTVPLKDSGVPWLGPVPAHWTVAPLYSRYAVQLGKMLNQEAQRGTAPAPYLRNTNVQWGRVDLTDLLEMDFSPKERQKFGLLPGDLLVCEGGEVGRTAIWHGELQDCYFQKAVHRVRPQCQGENARFLFYVLSTASNKSVFLVEGNQSTIVHLTAEKLRHHRFPFPPHTEQCCIVDHLDRGAGRIDALVAKVRTHMDRLREHRTALISAAVTGQIDVREAAG